MKYKIVFSIPVHEKYEVVLDQALNYLTLNPGCAIVYHISQGFNEADSALSRKDFERIISNIDGVFINPQSIRTGLSDIIQTHLLNFRYICSTIDFEYFSMCASNELFVKSGLYDLIRDYDCGVRFFKAADRPEWVPAHYASKDSCLKAMMKAIDVDDIHPSNIEGSFYSKKIFSTICAVIESYYDYREMKVKYPREEVYFSTVLWPIIKNDETIRVYSQLFTLVHWNIGTIRYDNMKIGIMDVRKSQDATSPFYSVKRIERKLDDYCRTYIRQQCGYYNELKKYYPAVEKVSLIKLFTENMKRFGKLRWKHIKYGLIHRTYKIQIPSQDNIKQF